MSSIILCRAARQLAARSIFRPTAAAATATRLESTSTVHENDPEVLEREKQRNLKGKQHKTSTPHKHAPGWNEYLASASEANIKADRAEGTPEVLQKSTTEYIRARDSGEEDEYTERDIHASSELKEEIQGPLRSAKGNVADRAERSEGVHGGKP